MTWTVTRTVIRILNQAVIDTAEEARNPGIPGLFRSFSAGADLHCVPNRRLSAPARDFQGRWLPVALVRHRR